MDLSDAKKYCFASTEVWAPLLGAQSSGMAAVLGCGAFPFPILEPSFPPSQPAQAAPLVQ